MRAPLRRTLIGLLVCSLLVVSGVVAGFSGILGAMRARGVPPGWAEAPFFPAHDPQAVRIIEGARAVLQGHATPGVAITRTITVPDAKNWVLSVYFPAIGVAGGPHTTTLEGGVQAAATRLWTTLPPLVKSRAMLGRSRLKLDHVVGASRAVSPNGGPFGIAIDKGLDGILLEQGGRSFRMLPSWSIERYVDRPGVIERARALAVSRDGWSAAEAKAATASVFRTRAFIESAPASGRILPLARANTDLPPLDAKLLRERITLAARYLARETGPTGRLTYTYDPETNRAGRGYNMLRHAGTTYSMLQAHRLKPDRRLLGAARRATEFFFREAMRADPKHPGEFFVVGEGKAKLGGAGLALCMFVEMARAAPHSVAPHSVAPHSVAPHSVAPHSVAPHSVAPHSVAPYSVAPHSVDLKRMEGLARHILRMQREDGFFESFYDFEGQGVPLQRSIFYPGEAILGLTRLHQLTGDARWLNAAVRGADYLVHRQWVALGVRLFIPPDAWLLQALEELDRAAPDADRAAYAFAIGATLGRNRLMDLAVTPPDLVGGGLRGIKKLPHASSAGSYGEALAAAARLEARRRPEEDRFRTWSLKNANFQLRNQFTVANSYFLPNPGRALGAFRERPDWNLTRNDHTQHNLSGLFGLLDLLDPNAPDVGQRGAP